MKYSAVVGCARCIAKDNVVVTSDYPFANLGVQPPKEVQPTKGLGSYNAVNVVGPTRSVLDSVRSRTGGVIITIDAVLDQGALGQGVNPPDMTSLKVRPLSDDTLGQNDGTNFVTECWKPFHHFEIVIRSGSFASYRFGVCKELMHVLTNQVEDGALRDSLDDKDKFRAAWTERCNRANDWLERIPKSKEEDLPYDETDCAFLALETMVPWNLRFQLRSFHTTDEESPWTQKEINDAAKAFIIPYAIIERIVKHLPDVDGKHKSYLSASTSTNEEYDRESKKRNDSLWCSRSCRSPR